MSAPSKSGDIIKGYEVDKDQYVIVEPEEIKALKLESKHTIDLFFERPYFLVPGDGMAGEGSAVIRDALRKTGRSVSVRPVRCEEILRTTTVRRSKGSSRRR